MSYKNRARAIFVRDKGRCVYCNRKVFLPRFCKHQNVTPIYTHSIYVLCQIHGEYRVFAVGTLDHVIPQSHRGGHEMDNLVLACGTCNKQRSQDKHVSTLEEVLSMNEKGWVCQCGNLLTTQGLKQSKQCSTCAQKVDREKYGCHGCPNMAKRGQTHCRRCIRKQNKKRRHVHQLEYYI